MAADNVEKDHLESIKEAIGRTRAMMFAVSLIASWLVASQIAYLLEWDPIRRPISYNLADMWTNSGAIGADHLYVRVPPAGLSPGDRVRVASDSLAALAPDDLGKRPFLTRRTPLDSIVVAVPFPARGSFAAKAQYVEYYLPFISSQWGPQDQYRAQLLHDRNLISKGVLPSNAVVRPRVTIPVVGLSLALDDITVTGAVLLLAMMVWVFFLVVQVRSSVELASERLKERWSDIAPLVSLQFLFLAPRSRQPHSLSYPLVYLPYIAVVFSIAVDLIYDLRWQNATYSRIMGGSGEFMEAFVGRMGAWHSQALGLLVIRYSVMMGICLGLLLLSNRIWRVLSEVSSQLRGGIPHLMALVYWVRLALMTLCPSALVWCWSKARLDSVDSSIAATGYSSSPDLRSAGWILGGLITIYLVLWGYWRVEHKWIGFVSDHERGQPGRAESPTD